MDKGEALFTACARRRSLPHDVCRLCDGEGDGVPHVFIDRYGALALVHLHDERREGELRVQLDDEKRWKELGIHSVYLRVHHAQARRTAQRDAALVCGIPVEAPFVVQEHGVSYEVDPVHQVNAGLFIDMRNVRRELTKHSSGKSVLNLFCFTGSLALAALVGGSPRAVQVDVSKSALSWAARNRALNPCAGEMKFVPEDARKYLTRVQRRGELFDIVIIDPPSFGTGAKGAFSFERECESLLLSGTQALAPGGTLYFTTNNRGYSPQTLAQMARAMLRNIVIEEVLPPAEDFPARGSASIAMRGVKVVRKG